MYLVSLVPSNWLKDKNMRLEAAFYNTKGVKETNIYVRNQNINKVPLYTLTVNGKNGIYVPGRFKRVYVSNSKAGYKFITGSNIDAHDITINCKYVSKKYTTQIDDLLLRSGSIIVTRSGKIGKTAYIGEGYEDIIGSDDLIRIVPDNNSILSGYVYAFLKSRIGHMLLCQNTYGSVIQHIEDSHLYDITIPIVNKSIEIKIHEMIEKSHEYRLKSLKHLRAASEITTNNLYGIDEEVRSLEIFTKNVRDISFSLAAYNCSQIGDNLKKQITSRPHLCLYEMLDRAFSPPLFKHIYLEKDNGFPFITGGELEKEKPLKQRFLSPLGVRNIYDYIVEEGWILVYKSGSIDGMIGSSFYVGKDLTGFCLSDHVIRLVPNKEGKKYTGWIFAFLRSVHGKLLLKQLATGSAIPFILPEKVRTLIIPEPLNSNQLNEVNRLVVESDKYRIMANILEQEAISIIEKEIG